MILEILDWIFEVDITATMAYSAVEAAEHCTCDFCRNFYAAVDAHCPQLRPFLTQFGIDAEAPDEMSPQPRDDQHIGYDPGYIVLGRILKKGSYEIPIGSASILPQVPPAGTYPWDRIPRGMSCFMLYVYDLTLPWVLETSYL